MITDEARKLQSQLAQSFSRLESNPMSISARSAVQNESETLMRELIVNCNPTESEFVLMLHGAMFTARMFFWMMTRFVDGKPRGPWEMFPDDEFRVKKILPNLSAIGDLALNGLITDGNHHKQWHLEKILEAAVPDFEDIRAQAREQGYEWESGIAP